MPSAPTHPQETFNPPPPSNWGLPDTGEGYTYSCFPRLRPELFGNIRKPRRLFKFPEQQRTGSKSANAAKMLQRSLSNLEKSAGSPLASPVGTPRGASKLAQLQKKGQLVPGVLRGIVRCQARWRMRVRRRALADMRAGQVAVARYWRAYYTGRVAREHYAERRGQVLVAQKVVRGWLARRVAGRRRRAAAKLQPWARMVVARRRYTRGMEALCKLQAHIRGRRARQSYLTIRELVVAAQATARGFMERRHALRERKRRLAELRRHIFALWKLAHTPLVYRAKFWALFDGSGFLHIAIHEDEAVKLWRDLGFLSSQHLLLESGNKRGGTGAAVTPSSGGSGAGSGGWPPPRPPQSKGPSPRLLAASTFQARFKHVEAILLECESVWAGTPTEPLKVPMSPPMAGTQFLGRRGPGQTSTPGKRSAALDLSLRFAAVGDTKHLSVAAERLEAERGQLYWVMKQAQLAHDGAARESFFAMFGLQHAKRRKRQLCAMVWQDMKLAEASTQVRPPSSLPSYLHPHEPFTRTCTLAWTGT
jgi:hypothetical protein